MKKSLIFISLLCLGSNLVALGFDRDSDAVYSAKETEEIRQKLIVAENKEMISEIQGQINLAILYHKTDCGHDPVFKYQVGECPKWLLYTIHHEGAKPIGYVAPEPEVIVNVERYFRIRGYKVERIENEWPYCQETNLCFYWQLTWDLPYIAPAPVSQTSSASPPRRWVKLMGDGPDVDNLK